MWDIQGLSVRACNVLKSTNVGSDTELLDAARSMTEKEFDASFLQIEMCGRKSLNEIKDYLLSKEPNLWGRGWQEKMEAALARFDSVSDLEVIIRLLSDEVMRLHRHVEGA